MTTQEIEQLLGVPNSTLSDWEKNKRRQNLALLLRRLESEEVLDILNTDNEQPKYSPKTRKITLNKKLFKKDLLWSRQDRSIIDIKNLITIYLATPGQDDTGTLLKLFGYDRVMKVLKENKQFMSLRDYTEALEQIEYAKDPQAYWKSHKLPTIDQIIKKPKKRHVNELVKKFEPVKIVTMAKEYGATYPAIFQLKKMTGLNA